MGSNTEAAPTIHGYLKYFRKNGEFYRTPFLLHSGNTKIGTLDNSEIRLKNDPRVEPIHCRIECNDNGLVTIYNESKLNPISVNGKLVTDTKVLKNDDIFEVCGKKFKYINEHAAPADVTELKSYVKDKQLQPNQRRSLMCLIESKLSQNPTLLSKTPTPGPKMERRESKRLNTPNNRRGSLMSKTDVPKIIVTPGLTAKNATSSKKIPRTISSLTPGPSLTPRKRFGFVPKRATISNATPKSILAKTPKSISKPAPKSISKPVPKTCSPISKLPRVIQGSKTTSKLMQTRGKAGLLKQRRLSLGNKVQTKPPISTRNIMLSNASTSSNLSRTQNKIAKSTPKPSTSSKVNTPKIRVEEITPASHHDFQNENSFITPENNISAIISTPVVTPDHRRSRHSKILLDEEAETTTPKSAIKGRRSKSLPYAPIVEQITPVTPENRMEDSFKTPAAMKSMSKKRFSRSRLSGITDSVEEEALVEKKGVKRYRESTGSVQRSSKRQKKISTESSLLETFDDLVDTDASIGSYLDEFEETPVKNSVLPKGFKNLTTSPLITAPKSEPWKPKSKRLSHIRNKTIESRSSQGSYGIISSASGSSEFPGTSSTSNEPSDNSIKSSVSSARKSRRNSLRRKILNTPKIQELAKVKSSTPRTIHSIVSSPETRYASVNKSLTYSETYSDKDAKSVQVLQDNDISSSNDSVFGYDSFHDNTELGNTDDLINFNASAIKANDSVRSKAANNTHGKSQIFSSDEVLNTSTSSSNFSGGKRFNQKSKLGDTASVVSISSTEAYVTSQSLLSEDSFTNPRFEDKSGTKRLSGTPKFKSVTVDLEDIKELLGTPKVAKSPKNDLSDVRGLKRLMRTPKVVKSPKNDLTNVRGVKRLMKTPKQRKTAKTVRVWKSPKNDLTSVPNLRNVFSPRVVKDPNNDLTEVVGVKRLMKTPVVQKTPKNDLTQVAGVKRLMQSPRVQNSPRNDLTSVPNLRSFYSPPVTKSPKNDLMNVSGIQRIMRLEKSPHNDLRSVPNLRSLYESSSPKNDLSNVSGVKGLLGTPRVQNSPKNDLRSIPNLRRLYSPMPTKSPSNDLSSVPNLRKLYSPRVEKSPVNDLGNVSGVRKLLRTPKTKCGTDLDVSGVDMLFGTPRNDVQVSREETDSSDTNKLFDTLLGAKPLRTYKAKSLSPHKFEKASNRKSLGNLPVTSPRVQKWLDEQANIVQENMLKKMKETPLKHKRGKENVPTPINSRSARGNKNSKEIRISKGKREQETENVGDAQIYGKASEEDSATDEYKSPVVSLPKTRSRRQIKKNNVEILLDSPMNNIHSTSKTEMKNTRSRRRKVAVNESSEVSEEIKNREEPNSSAKKTKKAAANSKIRGKSNLSDTEQSDSIINATETATTKKTKVTRLRRKIVQHAPDDIKEVEQTESGNEAEEKVSPSKTTTTKKAKMPKSRSKASNEVNSVDEAEETLSPPKTAITKNIKVTRSRRKIVQQTTEDINELEQTDSVDEAEGKVTQTFVRTRYRKNTPQVENLEAMEIPKRGRPKNNSRKNDTSSTSIQSNNDQSNDTEPTEFLKPETAPKRKIRAKKTSSSDSGPPPKQSTKKAPIVVQQDQESNDNENEKLKAKKNKNEKVLKSEVDTPKKEEAPKESGRSLRPRKGFSKYEAKEWISPRVTRTTRDKKKSEGGKTPQKIKEEENISAPVKRTRRLKV